MIFIRSTRKTRKITWWSLRRETGLDKYQPCHSQLSVNIQHIRTDHFIKAARRSHSSSVRLNVKNNSSVVLGARQLWVKGGEAVNTPGDVSPGHQETLLVTRDTHGNHGTVSYRLGNSNLIMTVMWTSGINCDHYANTLAIGLSDNQNTDKFK